jgi:Tfp pilus assembly protein PilZ
MTPTEQRLAPRQAVRLRVDLKPLRHEEVRDILEGHGYDELAFSSLSLSKPRVGMIPARIRDLSLGGVRIEGPVSLGTGEATALDLHLPDDRVVVKLLGEVVWSEPAKDSNHLHAFGLRFAALEENALARLKHFLELAPQGA